MKYYVWKPCRDQCWHNLLWFSIWRYFEQLVFVNNHLLCYWPTIRNSIWKICPELQVLSSHFFEVDELLDEEWAEIVQSENISTPMIHSMSNAIKCINQRFVFKNSGISCLALIFNLNNLRMTILHAKKLLLVAKHYKQYTVFFCKLTRNDGLVVKMSCSESGGTGLSLALCWTSLQCLGLLLGTEPVSALTRALLILVRSL